MLPPRPLFNSDAPIRGDANYPSYQPLFEYTLWGAISQSISLLFSHLNDGYVQMWRYRGNPPKTTGCGGTLLYKLDDGIPTKSEPSTSRDAGVNAKYAPHTWDSQEDSHSTLPSGFRFIAAGLNRLRLYFIFPISTLFHKATHGWPTEKRDQRSL